MSRRHRPAFPVCQSSHKRLAPHPTSPPSTSCPSQPSDCRFPCQILNSHCHHCRLQGELHRSIGLTPDWLVYLMPLNPLRCRTHRRPPKFTGAPPPWRTTAAPPASSIAPSLHRLSELPPSLCCPMPPHFIAGSPPPHLAMFGPLLHQHHRAAALVPTAWWPRAARTPRRARGQATWAEVGPRDQAHSALWPTAQAGPSCRWACGLGPSTDLIIFYFSYWFK
jgi:hypothetical protein